MKLEFELPFKPGLALLVALAITPAAVIYILFFSFSTSTEFMWCGTLLSLLALIRGGYQVSKVLRGDKNVRLWW